MDQYYLTDADIISKFLQIENHIGKCCGKFYVPTPYFNSFDEIGIQSEASNMMKFVGLENYLPVITYSNTSKNTGGNIELDNSHNVFIDINKDFKGDSEKVLAILAHEICHKVLYIHHLYYPNIEVENEILTDLATVFVGFGKLSLNGCYSKHTSTQTEYRDGTNVDVTTTYTNRIGYLSINQFALAYNIVFTLCYDNSLNKLEGLNNYAINAVNTNPFFYDKPFTFKGIIQYLKEVQTPEADITNSIVIIQNILDKLKEQIKSQHIKYNNELVLPFNSGDDNSLINNQFKVASALINNVSNNNEYDKENIIFRNFIYELNQLKRIDYSCLLNIECPCCGYKSNNKLQENRVSYVKCPKCGYYFLWNGEIIEEHYAKEDITNQNNSSQTASNNYHNWSNKWTTFCNSLKFRTRYFFKYLIVICFLLTFIPFCVYVDIHWAFKLIAIYPYTLVYMYLSKKLLSDKINAECVVKNKYSGGDFGIGYNGVGTSVLGQFGYTTRNFSSKYGDSFGVHRTYLMLYIFCVFIPVNCLILKKNTKIEDEIQNKERYTVYGTSKWYILEIIWLYLKYLCCVIPFILGLYGIISLLSWLGWIK